MIRYYASDSSITIEFHRRLQVLRIRILCHLSAYRSFNFGLVSKISQAASAPDFSLEDMSLVGTASILIGLPLGER